MSSPFKVSARDSKRSLDPSTSLLRDSSLPGSPKLTALQLIPCKMVLKFGCKYHQYSLASHTRSSHDPFPFRLIYPHCCLSSHRCMKAKMELRLFSTWECFLVSFFRCASYSTIRPIEPCLTINAMALGMRPQRGSSVANCSSIHHLSILSLSSPVMTDRGGS